MATIDLFFSPGIQAINFALLQGFLPRFALAQYVILQCFNHDNY
jgi:hypothetical protein